MKKFIACLAFTLGLMIATFGTALADTYDIPVIVGGKVVTITVEVKDSAVISASTVSKGVFWGKPRVRIEEKKVVEGGYWAKQIPDALDIMKVNEDKFTKTTFYESDLNAAPIDDVAYLYVGKKDKDVWLRFLATIDVPESIYLASMTFLADGQDFNFEIQTSEYNIDYISTSKYLLYVDIAIDEKKDWASLDAIAKAESVEMRFYGRDHDSYDYTLSEKEIRAFDEALAAYELLGGKH